MTRTFQPHPLLPGGQLQTLAGTLLPSRVDLLREHQAFVQLPDGDQLLLVVNEPETLATSAATVLLLHGLGGDADSSYIRRLTAKFNSLGRRVVRFNHRGCGQAAAPLAKRIYHAGRIEDLSETLAYLARRWPGTPLEAVAFSLSANLMLRYLGELGQAHPALRRTMAVCPPVDLELCSQALSGRQNWHIDRYFTRTLVAMAATRGALHPELKPPAFPNRINLRLFDELYTAPKGGFRNREDYYTRSSAKTVTHLIRVPTFILTADDDPIIPKASFTGVQFSRAVTHRSEPYGGHMGFIARDLTTYGDRRWMDSAVIDWHLGLA